MDRLKLDIKCCYANFIYVNTPGMQTSGFIQTILLSIQKFHFNREQMNSGISFENIYKSLLDYERYWELKKKRKHWNLLPII